MGTPKRKNRFKKKRPAARAKLRLRIGSGFRAMLASALLLGASAAFILAHDYFTQSRQFQARQIEVSGTQRLSRQQVLAIAGISEETNILAVNLTITRKRLLAQPWIADVTVSRKIPSGLIIRVREQQPLALMVMDAQEGFLMNVDGRIFSRQAPARAQALPRITGLSHADLPVDDQPSTAPFKAVMSLLALAERTDGPLSLGGIRRIHVDPEIGITVFTGEKNRAFKLGFGRYRQKSEALKKVLAQIRKEGRLENFQAVDLFDVDRIVITLASAVPSDTDTKEV